VQSQNFKLLKNRWSQLHEHSNAAEQYAYTSMRRHIERRRRLASKMTIYCDHFCRYADICD
jgi:hypothetical protein